ncbi:MAG TPA: hypothetical protein VFQ85_15830 [Mycobacteriales bacterium]|jgi:hypothetical protein|nr:hypothetical protein [Mycobacteriales bacterium]
MRPSLAAIAFVLASAARPVPSLADPLCYGVDLHDTVLSAVPVVSQCAEFPDQVTCTLLTPQLTLVGRPQLLLCRPTEPPRQGGVTGR